jgi:1-deoxy-D-xylulose-5-phosphate synthase
MSNQPYPLLDEIQSPKDIRALEKNQLVELADELRQYLINTISQCGGHFAAGLGTVELTVALHYLFNTPDDKLIWDVGHQAYPHKVLTGRKEQLGTIRQYKGVHPFPWPSESEYDHLAVGHSSTSISAALGIAIANQLNQVDNYSVAIIGDGALTAGMAFEALNHAGSLNANLLVILNDNDMSISENVGGLNNYLAKILSSQTYASMKEGSKKVLSKLPAASQFASRWEEHMKGMFIPGTLFEELGFNYIGPIDGHNMDALVTTLDNMKHLKGPQFLHVVTKKGKGYEPAENDPIAYHGVPIFDPTISSLPKSAPKMTYSKIFGDFLMDMAAQDDKLVAITPAMREGSGMVEYSRTYPDRYFDVGIAEQHAVTIATGMAIEGLKPVVAIYSTFLQRAYDQLIHDIALTNLDVLFAIDRAGLVGGDGATHNGAFDLSFMRCIPNMVIMAPSDENECRQMLYTGYQYKGPAAVRYPRGTGPGTSLKPEFVALEIGKANPIREGEKVAILNFGALLPMAKQVAEQTNSTLVDMRFIKPLDTQMLANLASKFEYFICIEENAVSGGAGSAVLEYFSELGHTPKVKLFGLPDQFIHHGTNPELMQEIGFTADNIINHIQHNWQ